MCYLVHGEGAAGTYGENTTGQILWVGQRYSLMQALAHHDGKLQRFREAGRLEDSDRAELGGAEKKGHSFCLSEGLAEERTCTTMAETTVRPKVSWCHW